MICGQYKNLSSRWINVERITSSPPQQKTSPSPPMKSLRQLSERGCAGTGIHPYANGARIVSRYRRDAADSNIEDWPEYRQI